MMRTRLRIPTIVNSISIIIIVLIHIYSYRTKFALISSYSERAVFSFKEEFNIGNFPISSKMDTINRKFYSISSTLGEQAEKIRILQESKAKNEDEIKELRESLSSICGSIEAIQTVFE